MEYDFLKVRSDVFDAETNLVINKLYEKKILKKIVREVAVGKEANVFLGLDFSDEPVAVKIYRTKTCDFKKMYKYIFGDPRFEKIRHNKRHIVFAWAQKEYSNLQILTEKGVKVPYPIYIMKNVLVMEWIGNSEPAPKLKEDWEVNLDFPEKLWENVKKMWEAKIIHADLSEYNILNYKGEPIIIDLGTGVHCKHPLAFEFLNNDIEKLTKIFKRLKYKISEEEIRSEAEKILYK